MSVPSLSSVQLSAMKNSRAYGIDKGKGGKSFIYCRVKTQLSTYSSLREPRSSPFVYAKINSLIYGQRTKGSSGHKPYVAFPIWKWNHVTIRIKEDVVPFVPLNEAKKNLKVFFFSPKNGMNVTCAFPAQSLFSSRFCSYFFLFSTESLNGMIDQCSGTSLKGVMKSEASKKRSLENHHCGWPMRQFIFIVSAVLLPNIFKVSVEISSRVILMSLFKLPIFKLLLHV